MFRHFSIWVKSLVLLLLVELDMTVALEVMGRQETTCLHAA